MWSVKCLFVFSLAVVSNAFDIIEVKPEQVSVKEGDSVTLFCATDNYWEWCKFSHADKICDYEWKKAEWNVTVLNCDDYADRAEFVADYDQYQCAMRLSKIGPEDAGKWSCEIESYSKSRYRNSGYIRTGEMTIAVTPKPEYDDQIGAPEQEKAEKGWSVLVVINFFEFMSHLIFFNKQ